MTLTQARLQDEMTEGAVKKSEGAIFFSQQRKILAM